MLNQFKLLIDKKIDLPNRSGQLPELINVFLLMRFIGVTALLLPIIVHGWYFIKTGQFAILGSVSEYYHSCSRDIFVGLLCAIGVCMVVYKGFARFDNRVSTIGGIAAIAVAFFPTGCEKLYDYCKPLCGAEWCDKETIIHYGSAAVLFVMLAIFCFRIFTANDDNERRSDGYNLTYRRSGWVILSCMAIMFIYSQFIGDETKKALVFFRPIFCLETLALATFGISWLTKAYWLKNKHIPSVEAKRAEASKKS